jgi:lariat debranching enzyme
LSHDWPASIEQHGDVAGLIRRKPFFRDDIRKVYSDFFNAKIRDNLIPDCQGALGSPPLLGLLHTLKPSWWFSAHLHVRFEARVIHAVPATENEVVASGENPDEIVIDDDDFDNPSKLESAENADEIKILLEDDDSDANINLTASNQAAAGVIDTSPEITTTSKIASITPKLDKDDGLSSATHGKANPDEIMLDDEEEEVEATITISNEGVAPEAGPGQPVGASRQETRFLALDKCLPRREYLEVC